MRDGGTAGRGARSEQITGSTSSTSSRPSGGPGRSPAGPRRLVSRSATPEAPTGHRERIFTFPLEESAVSTVYPGVSAADRAPPARQRIWLEGIGSLDVVDSRRLGNARHGIALAGNERDNWDLAGMPLCRLISRTHVLPLTVDHPRGEDRYPADPTLECLSVPGSREASCVVRDFWVHHLGLPPVEARSRTRRVGPLSIGRREKYGEELHPCNDGLSAPQEFAPITAARAPQRQPRFNG